MDDADDDCCQQNQNRQAAEKSQLFADGREDHIVVPFGKGATLHHAAVVKPLPGDATVLQGANASVHLIADALCIGVDCLVKNDEDTIDIRDCVENFQPSNLKASVLVKNLQSDHEEDDFIVKGIEKIVSTKEDKVAVLVRAGWQGNSVAQILDQKGILYFNALFKETDPEYISFYNIALEEFHNNVLGKAVQRNLKNCLLAVDARRNEIYQQESKKYIFESMYKLLEILFVESKKVSGTSRDKYDYIDFILGNKGLKHMMEFVDEQVVLTTIHAAKGLEWEYVIIPRLNGFAFPSSHMCRSCKEANSCNEGFDYCRFTYAQSLKKAFKEELSILYVGITRAKKNVFFTVNTGANKWNHSKTTSCLLNLEGLILEDYEWENAI